MKAETATIKINDIITLKVLLIPENNMENKFLEEALKTCTDFAVSASITLPIGGE